MADEPVGTGSTFNNLTINNKTVSEITNNSNNKIVDSIIMGNTIIYQRNEKEKIDTTIRSVHSELWLEDINGNGLMNKTVIAKICSNSIIETISITTGQNGLIGRQFDIKEVTFEGDYEYNGCSYINPVFSCK